MVDIDTVEVEIEINNLEMYEIAARIQNMLPKAKLSLVVSPSSYEAKLIWEVFPFVLSGEGSTPEEAFSLLEKAVRFKRAA